MAKSGLGTGLGALIGSSDKRKEAAGKSPFTIAARARPTPETPDGEAVVEVSITRIHPSSLQPRKHSREDQLGELVDSIREHGVIQPLIVRSIGDDRLELIAGERRWRACQRIDGLASVPVIIREASDKEVLEMALIENLQREDLDPIEEAQAYVRLSKEFDMRQEDIARRVGKNRATVANAMRLLELDPEVQTHLAQGRLSVGHAKVLLALKEPESQKSAADTVVKRGLTVRATERLLQHMQAPSQASAKVKGASALPPALVEIQNRLRGHLATSVRVISKGNKGRIEIEYYNDEDLERVLELIGLKAEEY